MCVEGEKEKGDTCSKRGNEGWEDKRGGREPVGAGDKGPALERKEDGRGEPVHAVAVEDGDKDGGKEPAGARGVGSNDRAAHKGHAREGVGDRKDHLKGMGQAVSTPV